VYTVIYVPRRVKQKLSPAARVRVIGTIHRRPYRGAIQPAGGGKHYLLLSKKFLKSVGLAVGKATLVTLALDDPSAVELLPEFENALRANSVAWQQWQALTPGARRSIAHQVASAKGIATRHARIEACLDKLIALAGGDPTPLFKRR
jgi:hypothetical protein